MPQTVIDMRVIERLFGEQLAAGMLADAPNVELRLPGEPLPQDTQATAVAAYLGLDWEFMAHTRSDNDGDQAQVTARVLVYLPVDETKADAYQVSTVLSQVVKHCRTFDRRTSGTPAQHSLEMTGAGVCRQLPGDEMLPDMRIYEVVVTGLAKRLGGGLSTLE